MKLASFLLLATLIPVATLAAQLPAYGAPDQAAVASEGDDAVAASQKALDAAEKALANAEETGGDIRAARRALANAMKSLRAAETATGSAATPATPAQTVRPAEPNPPPTTATTPAPAAAPPASATAEPKPYQPPTPPASAKPAGTAPTPSSPDKPAAPQPAVKPVTPGAAATPAAKQPSAQSPASRAADGPVVIRRSGGQTETRTRQPNGITVVEITDRQNRLIRRIEIARNGSETVTFDRDRRRAEPLQPPRVYDPREVPPPGSDMPPAGAYAGRGGLDGGNASEAEIERALRARPPAPGLGGYSLNEIRRSERLRGRVAAVDLDTITFESGSARVPDDQVWKLERIATALGRILARWPNQVFLIEGHTDAVGTRLANQELSDRRAASVAEILYRYFGIPGESLVTQGYGEDYLKIPTEGPARENRRVTIRNITPLLGR